MGRTFGLPTAPCGASARSSGFRFMLPVAVRSPDSLLPASLEENLRTELTYLEMRVARHFLQMSSNVRLSASSYYLFAAGRSRSGRDRDRDRDSKKDKKDKDTDKERDRFVWVYFACHTA